MIGDDILLDEPEIVKELREAERLGQLKYQTQNTQMEIQISEESIFDTRRDAIEIVDDKFHWNPENSELMELKTGVKGLLGFNTFQYRDSYLGRRFNSRMRANKFDNYYDYWNLLKADYGEQVKLIDALTINVTEFFRDRPVFEVFRNEVIPSILARKHDKIRVWSAGSADGKEAYSIAMIFLEILGEQNARERVEIISTDIDQDCLNQATQGVYNSRPGIIQADIEKQLEFIGNLDRYFEVNGEIFSVKPCLKEMVNFQYHDLISDPKKDNIDIIFCRNVVIYFTKELKKVLYRDFLNALNPGGYLIMGKTEVLLGENRGLFKTFNAKERIFIKE